MARSIFFYTDSRILGGAEEALFMLIEMLDRASWRPELVLDETAKAPLRERARSLEVPVHLVPPMPLGARGAVHGARFSAWLARRRPHVFHAQLNAPLAAKWPLAAAVLAGVPAVVATLQLVPPYELSLPSVLQLRALAHSVGSYFAVSRDIAQYLTGSLHLPQRKVRLLYNAVRCERYRDARPAHLPAPSNGYQRRPVVLTCARLDPQKGHDVLLHAAAQTPGAQFLLAGDGRERPRLEQLVQELRIGDRVLFLGHRTDVPELLAACDVFALPSRYEGSSLAVLEAMAAGRAIVASAIPGTDELIVDGESGILVAPGDPDALARGLARLLADETLRNRLARGACSRASCFAPETVVTEVTRVYEDLLANGRRH